MSEPIRMIKKESLSGEVFNIIIETDESYTINHITKDFPHPFVFASTTPYIRDNAMLEIRKYLLRKKGFSEDEINVFILEDMFITKYQQQGFSVLED